MKISWLFVFALTLLFVSNCFAIYNSHIPQSKYAGIVDVDDFEDDLSAIRKRNIGAHLLVEKRLMNKYLVESTDIVIRYRIYNVGNKVATNVHLRDPSLEDPSKFLMVGGITDANFGNLPDGMSITHVVAVRPVQSGTLKFAPAEITYSSISEPDVVKYGTSSEPGELVAYSTSAFNRKFSLHFEEWTAFGILSLPSLLIPYMLWFRSKSKYENLLEESDGTRKRRIHCYRDR